MDPKNEVEIPVDQVETALIQCAIPGFWGELTIEVCLERTAALEVTLRAQRTTVTHKDTTREEGPIVPSNERVQKVRAKLPELTEKFKVLCPVSQIRATFRDGHIMTFEVTEVKPLPPSRSLNVVSR
jgi:hypothetical protein